MEEFALVAFLAQSPQPVLAHHCLLTLGVSERTVRAFITCGLHEELAHSSSRFCLGKIKTNNKGEQQTGKRLSSKCSIFVPIETSPFQHAVRYNHVSRKSLLVQRACKAVYPGKMCSKYEMSSGLKVNSFLSESSLSLFPIIHNDPQEKKGRQICSCRIGHQTLTFPHAAGKHVAAANKWIGWSAS